MDEFLERAVLDRDRPRCEARDLALAFFVLAWERFAVVRRLRG